MLAIRLDNVSKNYSIKYRRRISIQESFPRHFLQFGRKDEFQALRQINLEIHQGETLGVIGRNGSGKSTLLKLICGVTFPTQGLIENNGRINGLLDLGAGFDPELTGRENIYLNAAILGINGADLDGVVEEIIIFTDIGSFIDAQLKTYSAGMSLRLGFSVAIHLNFDIFVIDEVFSVGDAAFQEKCLLKLNNLRRQSKTIIIATHSMDLLKNLCDRVALLEKGQIAALGSPAAVIQEYHRLIQ
jgi:ABC-type polysaccharide/polyol phosphate transport system ATPase subunit